MGKNLLHTNLALRNEKLAFYQVNGVSTRMSRMIQRYAPKKAKK